MLPIIEKLWIVQNNRRNPDDYNFNIINSRGDLSIVSEPEPGAPLTRGHVPRGPIQ